MKKITITIILLAIALVSNIALAQTVVVMPLGINSKTDDFSSAITLRSYEMYITSERDGNQEIFKATRSGDTWTIEKALGSDINSGKQTGTAALTPDGQYMVFAAYEHSVSGQGRTDLYSARKVKGKWTDVQNLGIAVNSPHWDSQPALSSDGINLFFVSDRPSQNKGTNIFYSQRTREGWTKAREVNFVNTDANEMSPYLAADNKTFTFSSDREGGKGGFDIYFAKIDEFKVTNIKNAGNVINTQYNEHFYVVEANSDIAYFSSDKPTGKGGFDIYTAIPNPHKSDDVVFVHGIVRDEITKDPLGSEITISDIGSGRRVATLRSDDLSGEYSVVLTAGRNYSITAERDGYIFYSENFNIPNKINQTDIEKDIDLSPIIGGKTRLLIFFDFDKSTLQDESMPELQRLVRFLEKNPDLNFELHGHTDNVGDANYNLNLSKERANTVRDYLVKSGIDANRIKTQGFGMTKPKVENKDDKSRALNRRVELVINS